MDDIIRDIATHGMSGDANAMRDAIFSALDDKIATVLDQKKIEVAANLVTAGQKTSNEE